MKYLITAGGTGGHIYPALYLAQQLVIQGHEVKFIASDRNVDHLILDDITDFEVLFYKMDGLSRSLSPKSIFKNIKNIFYTLNVSMKSDRLLKRFQPDFVIGFGGFVTYPVLRLATKKDMITAIHEQNSYPGLVNRKLAPHVDHVFYTYTASTKYFSDAKNLVFTSNPRGAVAAEYDEVVLDKNKILLVGGSLGAETINQVALELAKKTNFDVTLVCGERFFNQYSLDKLPDNLTLLAYSKNLVELFKQSQLVIARAGATTLIELVYSNTLAIAIPSPNVVANHQQLNAEDLQNSGVLEYILEAELDIDHLLKMMDKMINNQQLYYQQMQQFASIDSVALIQKELLNG